MANGEDPYGYCATQPIAVVDYAGSCRPVQDRTGSPGSSAPHRVGMTSSNGAASGHGSFNGGTSVYGGGSAAGAMASYLHSLRETFGVQPSGGRDTSSRGDTMALYLHSLRGSFGTAEESGDIIAPASADGGYIAQLLAQRRTEMERAARERDSDNDGLSDFDEWRIGTDPYRADTDNDGVGDAEEVGNVHYPSMTTSSGIIDALYPGNDSDRDGIPNNLELLLGTDPNDPDTDGDGVPDGREVGDPLRPFITEGARFIDALNPFNDSDGDGIANLDEVRDGTDPLDPLDPPRALPEDRAVAIVRTVEEERARQEREQFRQGVLTTPATGAVRWEWFSPLAF